MQSNKYPLVSVGVPTYNRPDGLRKTLKDICNQTYKNIEIIVSDNCSTIGDAKSITNEFISDVNSLHFYKQSTNIGAIENLNYVLSKASGKYFIWMADDDRCKKELINSLVTALEKNNTAVLCGCDISIIDLNDNVLRTESLSSLLPNDTWSKNKRKFFMCPISNVFLTIYGMYSLNTLRDNGIRLESAPNNKSMAIEIPFLSKLALCGEIIAVPETLKYYRTHDDSVFTLEQISIKKFDKFIVNQSIRYKLLRQTINSETGISTKMSLISAICESALMSFIASILPKSVKEFLKKRI